MGATYLANLIPLDLIILRVQFMKLFIVKFLSSLSELSRARAHAHTHTHTHK